MICDVKNKSRFLPPEDDGSPHALLVSLVEQANCKVVLGCTDLRIALGAEENLPESIAVDSLEVLADVIVKRIQEEVNKL